MFPGVCSVGALISLNKHLFRFRRWTNIYAILQSLCFTDNKDPTVPLVLSMYN